ncbi:MAG: diguanylate cyclase [Fibrobacteraceae bacterium]|nr:diguanylate cyclase [Fibrobacteraceae bacterium]
MSPGLTFTSSSLEEYHAKVLRWGVFFCMGSSLLISLIYLTLKFCGFLPDVATKPLVVLTIMDAALLILGTLFVYKAYNRDGLLKEGRFRFCKTFLFFAAIIQWNFILYLIPSQMVWAFIFFFALLMVFTLDLKSIAQTILILGVSLLLYLYMVKPFSIENAPDTFTLDMVTLAMAIFLSIAELFTFTYFMTHILVRTLQYKPDPDELTGTESLSSFNKICNFYQNRTITLALIFVEIVDYDKITESVGKQDGENILINVAAALKTHFRITDIVGRLDEAKFGILLPNFNPEFQNMIVEKIKGINLELQEITKKAKICLNAGMGISYKGFNEALCKKADSALHVQENNERRGIHFRYSL